MAIFDPFKPDPTVVALVWEPVMDRLRIAWRERGDTDATQRRFAVIFAWWLRTTDRPFAPWRDIAGMSRPQWAPRADACHRIAMAYTADTVMLADIHNWDRRFKRTATGRRPASMADLVIEAGPTLVICEAWIAVHAKMIPPMVADFAGMLRNGFNTD